MESIVVVGASLGGHFAVENLRRAKYAGKITLIGEEPHLPYDRPPLSKEFLRGEWERDRLGLARKPYEELGVELRLGVRAVGLDRASRRVLLSEGEPIAYDGIILATGARPRRLDAIEGRSNVHYLRGLDDALRLKSALKTGDRVVIIGAGFIGLEIAASCRAIGAEASVIEALEGPCARALPPALGGFLTSVHESRGVQLFYGASVRGFEGSDRVEAVTLGSGERLPVDQLIVGIGVTPNTEWLEGSGLSIDNGVLTSASLKAIGSAIGSDSGDDAPIFAIGDLANFESPLFGERMRVEHWTTTVEQARHAAKNLLDGASLPFEKAPFFWSDQYEYKLQGAGRARPDDRLEIALGSVEGRDFLALFERDGRAVGAYGVNRPAELVRARIAIERRTSYDELAASLKPS